MRRPVPLLLLAVLVPPAAAQTNGAVTGHVRQREGAVPIVGAEVGVDGRWLAATDTAGFYRIREVRSGWHLVTVRAIGFETVRRDSVLVRAGQISLVNFTVDVYTIDRPIVVEAYADSILDPALVATVQRIGGEELRRFPVTTLEEAVALSAGAVGESYRGGRLGQQAFVLDGLGVKNQLDASTGPLGVRIPPDMLTEASLVTNGFSARYGQALSGLINVVTRVKAESKLINIEETKGGAPPGEVGDYLRYGIRGLSTMPPAADDPEASRDWFRRLRSLAEEHGLAELSMGTTQDYRVAAEEGATYVRVGSILFT